VPGFIGFIAAFAALIAMQFTGQALAGGDGALLGAFGLLMGIAVSPTLVYYATTDPKALWAGRRGDGAVHPGAGLGRIRDNRDLSGVARMSFWALVAAADLGVVAIFVNIPHASVIYSVAGLVIFGRVHAGRLSSAAAQPGTSPRPHCWPRRSSWTPQRVPVLPEPVRRAPELSGR